VGDGINDSPGLVAATVGIALSSGTSVAIEAADIVLMRSDLLDVVAALHLSRSIFFVIKRNLVGICVQYARDPPSHGYFLAVWAVYASYACGGAMAFSSVSVVTSSLTLKWWRRPEGGMMPGEMVDGTGTGLGGMFLDSAGSEAGDVWGGVRGIVRGRAGDWHGYSQLPVEMSGGWRVFELLILCVLPATIYLVLISWCTLPLFFTFSNATSD
jgi:P-type Cu+ transporter